MTKAALNIPLHRWAIQQRANIQKTLLALYEYLEQREPALRDEQDLIRMPPPEEVLFDHILAASFSLWRAVFLVDTERSAKSVHRAQKTFLEKLISTNAIAFGDDKQNSAWAMTFYLEAAGTRVMAAKEFVSRRYPEIKTLDWITSMQDLVNGHLINAIYEWELIHSAVRMLFHVIQPTSNLSIKKPELLRGWNPDDDSQQGHTRTEICVSLLRLRKKLKMDLPRLRQAGRDQRGKLKSHKFLPLIYDVTIEAAPIHHRDNANGPLVFKGNEGGKGPLPMEIMD